MILVTGGAGYIGSHTCVKLIENGYEVLVCDNFYNSKPEVLDKIYEISGKKPLFYETDVTDEVSLRKVFEENTITGIIHFAGYKAVGESVEKPLEYYSNNINSTLTLCRLMKEFSVRNIIFSSSATVYGEKNPAPYNEEMPLGKATNPYGNTKIICEEILTDFQKAYPQINVTLLRYFNPIGAHPSGLLGEDPKGIPNNLFPYVLKVAKGELDSVGVFGNDYPTPDGTGIRDYIHVEDLAEAHVLALKKLQDNGGINVYNIGTGIGHSVMEVIDETSKACGKKINYVIKDRRPGDLAVCYADTSKAKEELGFTAKYDLKKMCSDGWNYISKQ